MSTAEYALMDTELSSINLEMGIPGVLTDPAGAPHPINMIVDYAARREVLGNDGFPVVQRELAVSLQVSACPAGLLPVPTGVWMIAIPQTPGAATLTTYLLDGTRDPEINATTGLVRFFPKRAVQG